jgi:hypothetical protein
MAMEDRDEFLRGLGDSERFAGRRSRTDQLGFRLHPHGGSSQRGAHFEQGRRTEGVNYEYGSRARAQDDDTDSEYDSDEDPRVQDEKEQWDPLGNFFHYVFAGSEYLCSSRDHSDAYIQDADAPRNASEAWRPSQGHFSEAAPKCDDGQHRREARARPHGDRDRESSSSTTWDTYSDSSSHSGRGVLIPPPAVAKGLRIDGSDGRCQANNTPLAPPAAAARPSFGRERCGEEPPDWDATREVVRPRFAVAGGEPPELRGGRQPERPPEREHGDRQSLGGSLRPSLLSSEGLRGGDGDNRRALGSSSSSSIRSRLSKPLAPPEEEPKGFKPGWHWPHWCLSFQEYNPLEVYVSDDETGEAAWVEGEPQSRVVDKEGCDAYLCVEYDWDGESYVQDFEPKHVRKIGSKETVFDLLTKDSEPGQPRGILRRR